MAKVSKLKNQTSEYDLVVWARSFVDELRAAQRESDRLARPAEHIVAQLKAAGAYSMTVPRAFGGLQVDMTTWLKTVTELGRGDGGTAWAVTLITAGNWMAASMYPRHVVEE